MENWISRYNFTFAVISLKNSHRHATTPLEHIRKSPTIRNHQIEFFFSFDYFIRELANAAAV